MTWGVKASLRSYLSETGGEIRVSDGATLVGGVIQFPAMAGRPGAFRGTVHFLAHGGMLDWAFSDPQIDESARLTVTDLRGKRFTLALAANIESPTLTPEGSVFFEGMYPLGALLDPIVFH
jgi:hypothetical protein